MVSTQREPGYDGVRAVAVLVVVAYHCHVGAVANGALGVDVFFVLSGFLITGILVDELAAHGRIAVGAFLLRRWSRLWPAAMVTVIIVAAVSAAGVVPAAHRVGPLDFVGALTYTTNYFLAEGAYTGLPTSLLTHFWTLATEEQFYLVWPFVLVFSWRHGRLRAVVYTALFVVVVGVAWRTLLYDGTNGLRLGAAPDTHGPDAFAMGAVLRMWRPRHAWWVGALGFAGLAYLAHGPSSRIPLSAEYTLAGLAGALIVAGAPNCFPLRWAPMVAIGRVSYGIYLIHPAVLFVLVERLRLDPGAGFALTFAISWGLAAASFRWLETPVRRRILRRRTTPMAAEAPGPVTVS